MKTKIEFEKVGEMMVMREDDRTRHFQILSAIGKQENNISHTEWEICEHDLPILQILYQRFCEKNRLQVTSEGYATYREYATHFGFKFEEEISPVFFDGSECQPDHDETVYAFYADGSESFAKFIDAEKSNTPLEPDYWFKIEDGTDEIPVKWCRIYPCLFD